MAEDENTSPQGEGNGDSADLKHLKIEARRVIAELIVMLESISAGLESLANLPEAVLLRSQLETLRGLVLRALESAESFDETVSGKASG